ncbi:regulatory protein RecX [Microbacterium sp. P02]|uniref:regulatory protein RecX n=1 Tax=Microbacterium sp. P02 TaxID=3366260 RepID=UPI00366CCE26
MTTDHGGEREQLAPVTPLFGERRASDTVGPQMITRALPDRPRRAVTFTDLPEDELLVDAAPEVGPSAPASPSAPTSSSRRGTGSRGGSPRGGAGEQMTEAEAEVDDRATVIERARVALTRSLGRRGLSIAEARSTLRSAGLDADEVDDAVEDFVTRGWLDDALLAEQIVHGATTRKDMGSRAIRQLLVKRLVSRDVVDAVVAELPDDDVERALEFATTKARSLVRYDDETAMRRLMGQLGRRGFGGSVASTAARTAMARARDEAGGGSAVRFR